MKKIKNVNVLFLVLSFIFLYCCKKIETPGKVKSEVIDGVKHVYNNSTPLKGTITLEVEKVFEIDSAKINNSESFAHFQEGDHDSEGNLYLLDRFDVKIYKFSHGGKLLKSFLGKGEGPGELLHVAFIQVLDNNVRALLTRQFARFDLEGNFLEQKKFKKSYLYMDFIDENKFIGNFDRFKDEEKSEASEKTRVAAIIDTDEKVVTPLLEDKNAGFARIQVGNSIVIYANPELTPVILHSYDSAAGNVYLCVNNEYKIIVKNLKGETLMVIHREHQNIKITPEIAKDIMEGYRHWRPERRQILEKNLPGTFTAARLIKALPNGFFAVYRNVGAQKSELDIFDKDGLFVYTVKPSEDIPDLKLCIFFKNRVGSISSEGIDVDKRDVYKEFRIINLPEIFGK